MLFHGADTRTVGDARARFRRRQNDRRLPSDATKSSVTACRRNDGRRSGNGSGNGLWHVRLKRTGHDIASVKQLGVPSLSLIGGYMASSRWPAGLHYHAKSPRLKAVTPRRTTGKCRRGDCRRWVLSQESNIKSRAIFMTVMSETL